MKTLLITLLLLSVAVPALAQYEIQQPITVQRNGDMFTVYQGSQMVGNGSTIGGQTTYYPTPTIPMPQPMPYQGNCNSPLNSFMRGFNAGRNLGR